MPLFLEHRLSPVVRRSREGGKGEAADVQNQKERERFFGQTAGGQGGGRPSEMPRLVIIDEEGGLRRQRRLTQLPYWHENPAL